MQQEQAITVLLQVAQLAQAKGILSLEDAAIVNEAVKTLKPKDEQPKTQEETKTEE